MKPFAPFSQPTSPCGGAFSQPTGSCGGGSGRIRSRAYIGVEACGRRQVIESNEVVADTVRISVCEEQSCHVVLDGSELAYTVRVTNHSPIEVYNVEFTDIVDGNAQIIRNTFRVNGVPAEPTVDGRAISYTVPSICAGTTAELCFSARVM